MEKLLLDDGWRQPGEAMTEERFSGKTALVTGGSRGIGKAVCELLASHGARVAVNYRSRERAAAETVAQITAAGGQTLAVRADVSDADQVAFMIREVTQQLGPIDLLVNNAGVFHVLAPGEVPREVWQQTLDINLTGSYLVTWAVKDKMIERRFGRIVNVSLIAGLRSRPRSIAYAVSKARSPRLYIWIYKTRQHGGPRRHTLNCVLPPVPDCT
jgi:3-oxoacyl-[acyl-carrier protein] reductase